MEYDDSIREAAGRAAAAIQETIDEYRKGEYPEEPALNGAVAKALKISINGQFGGLVWTTRVLKSSGGEPSEEGPIGADFLFHFTLQTGDIRLSKGVLVQAKRTEPNEKIKDYKRLITQCNNMLDRTAASFVFAYSSVGMRCGAASTIAVSKDRRTYDQCVWTPYRFFLELFRCPIGDPRLPMDARELLVPYRVKVKATTGHSRI